MVPSPRTEDSEIGQDVYNNISERVIILILGDVLHTHIRFMYCRTTNTRTRYQYHLVYDTQVAGWITLGTR